MGPGSLGVAVIGVIVLGESVSPPRVVRLALILVWVIGLKAVEG